MPTGPSSVVVMAELIDDVLPSFTSVNNDSLLTGSFPSVFKSAVVRPLLKTPTLDTKNVTNYRPVCSTLPSFPRSLKRFLLLLSQHLESNHLLYPLQSAYRSGHSTETALLKIVNDLAALDVSHISLLSVLDLSAAFDTIDHSILLSRLHHTFGISAPLYLGFSHTSLIELRLYLSMVLPPLLRP